MSSQTVIMCDGCRKEARYLGWNAESVRRMMREDGLTGRKGWKVAAAKGHDYCPDCRKLGRDA